MSREIIVEKKIKSPLLERLQESGVVFSSKNNIGLKVQKSCFSGDFAKNGKDRN